MVKPVTILCQAAEELSNGRLITIPNQDRQDEIGQLTQSFNKMALRITQTVSGLEKAVALRTNELEERNRELKLLSTTDDLTGIPNRRQFDTTLQAAWRTSLRNKKYLGLFMIDIDFFKYYNDTYGHLAGDSILRIVGQLLQDTAHRSTDLVARYGGEEFVILIQNAEPQKLNDYAKSIAQRVEALNIEHTGSAFKIITVSIGVAYLIPSLDDSPETLLAMADEALYRSKDGGRNRAEENGRI